MKSNLFLWINGLVVFLLVLRLVWGARGMKPTGLNMDSREPNLPLKPNLQSTFSSDPRPLNCPFQYNGHDWDAFEVLGVPAGSSKQACQRAYHDLRRNRPGVDDFLGTAWEALESHFSKT